MRTCLIWIVVVLMAACAPKTKSEKEVVKKEVKVVKKEIQRTKTPDKKGTKGRLVSAEVVTHPFVNKIGESIDLKEYYIRRSIQDYFIKFCESEVSREELQKAISTQGSHLSLEIDLKKGEWDSCEGEPSQSRIGEYAIIYKILE